jgi:NADH-quinone oxidoreductase subunit C
LNENPIIGLLRGRFQQGILVVDTTSDMLTVTVSKEIIHAVIRFLKEDQATGFGFLTTMCGIHYPDQPLPYGVIYHLHNLEKNIRVRIKTFLPEENLHVPTITGLFSAANWLERETYDFYGIIFDGHPNLIRILNVEYLDFFPMRKGYPLEDPTREDKDDRFFGR